MRILSARIFSKSFGGKIKQFSNRCYIEAIIKYACIFLAGKYYIFEQRSTSIV